MGMRRKRRGRRTCAWWQPRHTLVTTHLTKETPIHPHNHLAPHPSKYHLIHLIHLTPVHLSLPGGQKWGKCSVSLTRRPNQTHRHHHHRRHRPPSTWSSTSFSLSQSVQMIRSWSEKQGGQKKAKRCWVSLTRACQTKPLHSRLTSTRNAASTSKLLLNHIMRSSV